MTSRPDGSVVAEFLARASRRLAWRAAVEGAAGGLVAALLFAVVMIVADRSSVGVLLAVGAGCVGVGALGRTLWSRRERRAIAHIVERRVPQSRNLVVTASELDRQRVAPHIADLVSDRAARLVRELDLAELFPARKAVAITGALLLAWTASVGYAARAHAVHGIADVSSIRAAHGALAIGGIRIEIVPPTYANRPTRTVDDPSRIDALAGSRLHIVARANADRLVIETLESHDTIAATNGSFAATIAASADGYIALEPHASNGAVGARRLIGLSVTPDAPPRVRISAPGKDLFLDDAHRTLDVAIDASDDLGLASLALKYTKVSGSGERFTFSEGTVPLTVARPTARSWTARTRWNLDSLGLSPGDMVVYRAIATDQRPGAVPSESDSYIAEVLIAGGGAAAGFSVDPEQERYAVSQQMVILKTERLSARTAQMSADDYATAAAELAAEQRKVRAEFVFMMGGELADAPDAAGSMTDINEEAEAEGEDDLLAGRNANKGRVALVRAIRSMSRAATSLNTADLQTALPHERDALKQLESAFSHARILLRALTEREQLDLSRRLSGSLTDAASDARAIATPPEAARTTQLRAVLSGIASLAAAPAVDANAGSRASMLAEQVLRIDASDKALQSIASTLSSAAEAIAHGRRDDARRALDTAATSVVAALGGTVLVAPQARGDLAVDRMRGALDDALRTRRGPP